MKIGILQTGHAIPEAQESLGDYDAMFARLLDGHGFDYATYNVVDGAFPASAQACDGWLITGSKHGVYEDHPWIAPLEELIRDIYADGRPLVGICFGHQIIAQALGGKVEKFGGGWSVGRVTYEIEGRPLALNAWHQDQVTALPPDAKSVGSSDFCAHAALVYGERVYSVQPHPEFTAEMMDYLIRLRGKGVVPDDILAQAASDLPHPTDSGAIADRIAEFFKKRA